MLVIRMQRTGRKGHAQFRVVVQDSRRTPTSGKIVAALGHFDPHSKQTSLNKEKASFYLEHGAQPSDRVIRLLKSEGVKLPKWVSLPDKKKAEVRNPEKRRSTAPAEPKEIKEEAPAEEKLAEDTAAESVDEQVAAESEKTGETNPEPEEASDAPAESTAEPEKPAEPEAEEPEA